MRVSCVVGVSEFAIVPTLGRLALIEGSCLCGALRYQAHGAPAMTARKHFFFAKRKHKTFINLSLASLRFWSYGSQAYYAAEFFQVGYGLAFA
jgi:hypothetical protein